MTVKSSWTNIDGWANVLTGLGVKGRDKNTATTYRQSCLVDQPMLDSMYRTDGYVKRIIELPAYEMIRQGWEIEGDTDNTICQKFDELDAEKKLIDLIKWARLYGGALIVMGIADGRELDQPVNESNINNIKWLHVFDRYQAFSQDGYVETDLDSPNYGYPRIYQVNDTRTGNIFFVHHSRVLRMDWTELIPRQQNYNNGWGDSVVQSIYEELKNYSTVFANTGLMIQDFVNGILKIPGLNETMVSGCDEQVRQRLDILNMTKGVTNTIVLDGQEDYEKITTSVTGLADLIDKFMETLSSVSGIPITLLFGRTVSGLNANADQDTRNYYDYIKCMQEGKLKSVLDKLIKYIFLSKNFDSKGVEPESWDIKFNPLWQVTEEQESLIKRTTAETDRIYIETGVLEPSEVAISRFGGDAYSTNTEIDIESRENDYNINEMEELEYQKEQKERESEPDPSIGPDFVESNISNPRRV